MGFVEHVRDTVGKYGVGVRVAIAVFGLVLVGEVYHRKHIGCVAQGLGNLEMVTAVVPAAREVVVYLGTVFKVAGGVEMGLGVAATLDAEELQGVFEDGVVDGRVHVEGGRGVVAHDDVVFALGIEGREVGTVQVFFLRAGGVLRAELVDAGEGVERSVDPHVGLYDVLADERQVAATGNFPAGIRVDDLERHLRGVGHVGVLVVLWSESALVDADGAPVVDVQGVKVPAFVDLVGAVDDG